MHTTGPERPSRAGAVRRRGLLAGTVLALLVPVASTATALASPPPPSTPPGPEPAYTLTPAPHLNVKGITCTPVDIDAAHRVLATCIAETDRLVRLVKVDSARLVTLSRYQGERFYPLATPQRLYGDGGAIGHITEPAAAGRPARHRFARWAPDGTLEHLADLPDDGREAPTPLRANARGESVWKTHRLAVDGTPTALPFSAADIADDGTVLGNRPRAGATDDEDTTPVTRAPDGTVTDLHSGEDRVVAQRAAPDGRTFAGWWQHRKDGKPVPGGYGPVRLMPGRSMETLSTGFPRLPVVGVALDGTVVVEDHVCPTTTCRRWSDVLGDAPSSRAAGSTTVRITAVDVAPDGTVLARETREGAPDRVVLLRRR